MKILLLEDELSILSFISLNLKREGFEVLETMSGTAAISMYEENPDISLAVLDVMLPDIDGFEVLKYIRAQNSKIGIIMLTARTNEQDKVKGLGYGADDYMEKPFSPAELIARIKSLLRRVNPEDTNLEIIKSGNFTINITNRTFYKDEKEIDLTPKEFEILELFLKNKNKSLQRDFILNNIWGKNYFGDYKVVDVNIRRIRKKIENDATHPEHLKTVWGYGYRWEEIEN